ncbi:uncharacterized protein [Centruroides vittatus]|uniref:uncharacterized protein n=1 Tax=Centruroides vittatus TaxID=120091 RepID=UPI00351091A2
MKGLLCELVIRKLEKNIIEDFADRIVIYKRYVDDVLIIWKDDQRINDFLTAINDNEHGLKLQLEQNSRRNIQFLNINMEFKLGNIQTTVYLKLTHAPLYIPACSKDPFKYKLSAFKALIKRTFLYCTDVLDRNKEINRIQKVEKNLGYKMSTIKGVIKSYSKQKNTTATNNSITTFNKFTYNEQARKVVKELGKYKNTNIVYKRAPNIYRLLRNDKDTIGMDEQAGVYSIPYENQQLGIDKEYIGVTRRSLKVRVKEHKYSVSKGLKSTILASMAQADGAVVKWNEAKIAKTGHSPSIAMEIEKIEIYKSKMRNRCLNSKDANTLPSAWKYKIEKSIGFDNP